MRKIKMTIGEFIWWTSEEFKIPLGYFAPIIFHWMIGATKRKILND